MSSTIRKLTSDLKIDDTWKNCIHRPATITFHFVCSNLTICEQLADYMRDHSAQFDALEIEFMISGQNSFRRDLKVLASNIRSGNFLAELISMHKTSAIRYLKSDDMNLLLSETNQTIFGSLITERGYVETGSEVKLREAIEKILEKTEVEVSDFEDIQWESVFWEPSRARPDKLTSLLNQIITIDAQNSSNFQTSETGKSDLNEVGFEIDGYDINVQESRNDVLKLNKNEFLSNLHEVNENIEWTGEKFIVKPIKLFRINLSSLNSSTQMKLENVQVENLKSTYSIPIRVNNRLPQQNPTLTHTLVMQRLVDKTKLLRSQFLSKLDPINAKLNSLPGWPEGSYCIFKSGDCPSEFTSQSTAASGLRTWAPLSTSGAGKFGNSSILQSSENSVSIIIESCCK